MWSAVHYLLVNEHFGPPLISNSNELFAKNRNLKYRYMPDQSLFPIEVNQYDHYVICEALHNCIAHQDYTLQGRINVVEKSDELIFTNVGDFIPKAIEIPLSCLNSFRL
jgi:ATP-dependent DNA helicase RecG